MTVLTESSSRSFQGNDVADEFSTGFRFLDAAHLTVTEETAGVETVLVEGVDYTVSGEGDVAGGTVTTTDPVATGTTLTIERNTPILQEVELRPQGQYLPSTIMGMVDKLTLIAQENRRNIETLQALGAELADPDDVGIFFVDKTFLTDADAAEADFPLSVAIAGGSTATGWWCARLRNLDDPSEVFETPPSIQAEPGVGDTISLIAVDGLKPATNYTIRLAVVIP